MISYLRSKPMLIYNLFYHRDLHQHHRDLHQHQNRFYLFNHEKLYLRLHQKFFSSDKLYLNKFLYINKLKLIIKNKYKSSQKRF